MRTTLLRNKPNWLTWRNSPPLKAYSSLSHILKSEENNNKLIKPPLPSTFSHLSEAQVHALSCHWMPWSLRNAFSRSYASRSAKKLIRQLDVKNSVEGFDGKMTAQEEEDDDECNGEITADDIKEELLRGKDNDDEEDCWEEEEEEEVEAQAGDGGDGGGVVFGGTSWGSKALAIAEEVLLPYKDDLKIYAFKVSHRCYVYVRLDKLSDKRSCPTIDDLETFHSSYADRLEEVGQDGGVPDNLAVEVSTPGAERFIRVPEDLERFKGLPMYVSYFSDTTEAEAKSKEQDGIFELDSFDMELRTCTLKLANVKVNREVLGRGRSLSKKKRDWRLVLPFSSLKLVRLYME